jgi:hypothetical protein
MLGNGIKLGTTIDKDDMTAKSAHSLSRFDAYRMRWKRRRLLWRSFRSRWQIKRVIDVTSTIDTDDVLLFATVRNEIERLPHFLNHYRTLGVSHFLIVDNVSDDGSKAFLEGQPDVSLWETYASYRKSRFGLDWITWLQIKHAHGHWCVTADADELLDYVGSDEMKLPELGAALEHAGQHAFGALLLDLYPKGQIGSENTDGDDPLSTLRWFDASQYRATRQRPMGNLWVQGGARERVFFSENPNQSPTLNKLPFVKWNRRFSYVNSTHSMLPPKLNFSYDGPGDNRPSGVLLHTKFLPSIVSKSETERQRAEHFATPSAFAGYYDKIAESPDMWDEASVKYEDPLQLQKMGLIGQNAKP